MWLMPLLQKSPDVVTDAISSAGAGDSPLPAVLQFALECWSDYWAGLALGWLEAGYPSTGLLNALEALKDSRQQPNPCGAGPSACGARHRPHTRMTGRSSSRSCDGSTGTDL